MTEQSTGDRPRVVGVRFERHGPIQYFDAGDTDVRIGDTVIVPGPTDPRVARVVITPEQVLIHPFTGLMPRLIAVASAPPGQPPSRLPSDRRDGE